MTTANGSACEIRGIACGGLRSGIVADPVAAACRRRPLRVALLLLSATNMNPPTGRNPRLAPAAGHALTCFAQKS